MSEANKDLPTGPALAAIDISVCFNAEGRTRATVCSARRRGKNIVEEVARTQRQASPELVAAVVSLTGAARGGRVFVTARFDAEGMPDFASSELQDAQGQRLHYQTLLEEFGLPRLADSRVPTLLAEITHQFPPGSLDASLGGFPEQTRCP